MSALDHLERQLIVSCQAPAGSPLASPPIIAALARAAELGGAAGIRADSPANIRQVRHSVDVPIVGIYKVPLSGKRSFITPTFQHACAVVEAGADIIALEATFENQPDDAALEGLIRRIQEELRVPVMADISTFEEGMRAHAAGSDLVATTLSGYTRLSVNRAQPDLDLVTRLAGQNIRVVCEGHVIAPEQVESALAGGAWAVVVGTAITDPRAITSWFAAAAHPGASKD